MSGFRPAFLAEVRDLSRHPLSGAGVVAIALTGASRAVPTPAGLGAMEGAQVTLFAATAGRPELGFVVAVVMRLHETLWIAVGLATLTMRGVPPARLWRRASGSDRPAERRTEVAA